MVKKRQHADFVDNKVKAIDGGSTVIKKIDFDKFDSKEYSWNWEKGCICKRCEGIIFNKSKTLRTRYVGHM